MQEREREECCEFCLPDMTWPLNLKQLRLPATRRAGNTPALETGRCPGDPPSNWGGYQLLEEGQGESESFVGGCIHW